MPAQVTRKADSIEYLVHDLHREGYYLLGEGFFSKVYEHADKPDEVIKVTRTYGNERLSWEYLDGWLKYFFRFILIDEAYQSPHTPLVYDVTFYDDGYTARMERLVPVNCDEYWTALDLPIVEDITTYGNGRTDLHQANVMKRQSKLDSNDVWECLVITDPYA